MCKPYYNNNQVQGNICCCFNSIETNLIRKAHIEIDSRKIKGLNGWTAWTGKRIMGDTYVNNIADNKVELAKRKAEQVMPGIINKILFQSFILFFTFSIPFSLFYIFIFFAGTQIAHANELFIFRVIWLILVCGYFAFYITFSIKNNISKIVNNLIKQVANAAN